MRGESYSISLSVLVFGKSAAGISAIGSRFAYKHPTVIANTEQGRESITVSILRLLVERSIKGIYFLISGMCSAPSRTGVALRSNESRGRGRNIKRSGFGVYMHGVPTAENRKRIAKSHIVVRDIERYEHCLPFCVFQLQFQLICHIMCVCCFGTAERIFLIYFCRCRTCYRKILGKISCIGNNSQTRRIEKCLTFVIN